jgi:ribonuclease H2 subunit A
MAEKAERPLVNVSEFIANPLGVHNLESPIPTITRDEECLMGIDEAGRGPVLGPMVYGTCYCPLSRTDSVKALGVADSKTLKEIERETMFRKISDSVDWLGWKVSILSPDHISNCMLRR